MQSKVEICGVNTSKLKVLKNEEMVELLKRSKAGDMDAREQLIRGNLRLVLSVIQRFGGRGENVDDLFQVGCIGLIKAIDNFNTELDVKFSTYGVPMMVHGRNKKGGSAQMTRKEAIFEAIRLVKVSKLKMEQKYEIVKKLELCQLELPFAHWTEAAIFDACDQFIAEKGRPLWVNDFDQYAELPSHPTIQNRFGMTARQFRDTYYPLPPEERPDSDQRVAGLLEEFKAELARCGAHTREEYDDLRDKSLPCSTTILRRAKLTCWRELLEAIGTTPEAIKRRRTPQAFATSFRLEHEGKVFEEKWSENHIA